MLKKKPPRLPPPRSAASLFLLQLQTAVCFAFPLLFAPANTLLDSDNTPTPKKRVKAEAASDDENGKFNLPSPTSRIALTSPEEEEKQLAKKSKKENGWTAINEKKANGKAKTEAEGDENEDSKEDVDMKEEEKPDNEEAV